MENTIRPLLDSAEIMQVLKISEATLVRMKKRKEIPWVKVGASHRYDLEKVLRAMGVPAKNRII
jgi:hypothetical protein